MAGKSAMLSPDQDSLNQWKKKYIKYSDGKEKLKNVTTLQFDTNGRIVVNL